MGVAPDVTHNLCILPLNIINDKIFFLTALTLYKLLYRALVFLSPNARETVLNWEISRSVLKEKTYRRHVLETIARSHSDFLFIEIFNNNADNHLVQHTMRKILEMRQEQEREEEDSKKHGKE